MNIPKDVCVDCVVRAVSVWWTGLWDWTQRTYRYCAAQNVYIFSSCSTPHSDCNDGMNSLQELKLDNKRLRERNKELQLLVSEHSTMTVLPHKLRGIFSLLNP